MIKTYIQAIIKHGLKENKMTNNTDLNFTVPSNSVDRKKIKDALNEACGLKQMISDKQGQIKDIVDYIYTDYQIPKKTVRKMINTRFKHNYPEVSAESALFEVAYETIMGESDND